MFLKEKQMMYFFLVAFSVRCVKTSWCRQDWQSSKHQSILESMRYCVKLLDHIYSIITLFVITNVNNWGMWSHHIALLFFNLVWIYLSFLTYFNNFVCFHIFPHIHIISTYSNTCIKMYCFLIKTGIIIQTFFSIFLLCQQYLVTIYPSYLI